MADADTIPRVVVVVVFDGVKLLDAVGPAEVFAEANRFAARYSLQIVSVDGRDARNSMPPLMFRRSGRPDTVVVAGSDQLMSHPIDPALVQALQMVRERTRRLAAVCTGSFVLAQAGLLDGKRATTHWRHTARMARAFPGLGVENPARSSSATATCSPRRACRRASTWP